MAYNPYWKNWKPDSRAKSPGKIIAPAFRCYPEFDRQSLDVVFFYLLEAWNATPADALDELTLLLRFADVTPALPEDWCLIDHHGTVAVLAPDGTTRLGSAVWVRARKDVRYNTMIMAGRPVPAVYAGPFTPTGESVKSATAPVSTRGKRKPTKGKQPPRLEAQMVIAILRDEYGDKFSADDIPGKQAILANHWEAESKAPLGDPSRRGTYKLPHPKTIARTIEDFQERPKAYPPRRRG